MHNLIDKGANILSLADWNDARLILAIVKGGSFSAAAQALGLDQATVSRRIGALEGAAGRPLFERRRRGAQPTPAGLALAELAERMAGEAEAFERALSTLSRSMGRTVTIAASEGIISYLIAPALLHGSVGPLISDQDKFQGRLPSLSFVAEENSSGADISILTLGPDQVPSTRSAMRVRKIGTMKFTPVASKAYLERTGMPKSFDDIVNFEILDHSRYKSDKGLSPWNELIAARSNGPNLVVDTTSGFYIPLISGCGIALLPPYAPLYEESLTILDVAAPLMAIELWLAAHEDSLREPAVRTVYDAVAQMFLSSRWFR